MIDIFGEALEYDLHHHLGLDLLEWFRGRYSWPKLLRLVRQLPRYSRFCLAVADDDDLAATAPADDVKARPALTSWDAHQDLVAVVREEFAELRRTVLAPWSRRPPAKPAPVPRPITAAERARRRAERQTHARIVRQVLPPGR